MRVSRLAFSSNGMFALRRALLIVTVLLWLIPRVICGGGRLVCMKSKVGTLDDFQCGVNFECSCRSQKVTESLLTDSVVRFVDSHEGLCG